MERAAYMLGDDGPLRDVFRLEEPFPYDRVYIGHDICERLLPDLPAVQNLATAASEAGVKVTLVTPGHLRNATLASLTDLFDELDRFLILDEVVFNDWGVLEALRSRTHLKPVLGRMLNRMKRDPRVDPAALDARELQELRSTNLTNGAYAEFLAEYGVDRVEFDNVPQGIDLDPDTIPFRASLYYPIIIVAALDQCVIARTREAVERRHGDDGCCLKQCHRYAFQIRNAGVTMLGKATYMVNDSLERVNLRAFDRIVRVFA